MSALKIGWKTRAGLVLSAVWLCLVFLVTDEHQRFMQVLGLGLLPLVIIWGIVWAVAGWRGQRPDKPLTPEAVQLEAKARRSLRIRTAVAVVAVLGLGMFAATWQFNAADNEAGGHDVARWFGEWCVYGLFAYAILRAVPKLPAGSPAVLAALIIVGAVNYKAHSAIAEDRQALESLAKATPLINKIQSGTQVSDQEVRDARVGMMEPLMLAQAAYSREVLAIGATYEKAVGNMQPELMLTPASLASPSIRVQTRGKLKLWQQTTAEYKAQIEGAIARGKAAIQAAELQMPAAMAGSASKGFDETAAQMSAYLTTLVTTEREASAVIVGMLDLMDTNPGGYVVDKGPPVNLLFRDEATLAKYRELMGAMLATMQREQEAKARLTQAQSYRAEKLGTLFKR
jgi:hypothetical protein